MKPPESEPLKPLIIEGEFVIDSNRDFVIVCDGCGELYSDLFLQSDPHFICDCGRLGQRMDYATPEDCRGMTI